MPSLATAALDAAITANEYSGGIFRRSPNTQEPNRTWRIVGPVIASAVVAAIAIGAFWYARRLRSKRKRLSVTTKWLEQREVLADDLRDNDAMPLTPVLLAPNDESHSPSRFAPSTHFARPMSLPVPIQSSQRPVSLPIQTPYSHRLPCFPPQAVTHASRARPKTTIVLEYRPPRAVREAHMLEAWLPPSERMTPVPPV